MTWQRKKIQKVPCGRNLNLNSNLKFWNNTLDQIFIRAKKAFLFFQDDRRVHRTQPESTAGALQDTWSEGGSDWTTSGVQR